MSTSTITTIPKGGLIITQSPAKSSQSQTTQSHYNDFDIRQKSGMWNLPDHYSNVNHIRDSDHPNLFLLIGSYHNNQIDIFDLFHKSKLTTSTQFNHQKGILFDISYNDQIEHVAICSASAPYLRIFSTENLQLIDIHELSKYPINKIEYSNSGDRLFVSYTNPNDYQTHFQVYETERYEKVSSISGVYHTDLIYDIKLSDDDSQLFISYYNIEEPKSGSYLKIYQKSQENSNYTEKLITHEPGLLIRNLTYINKDNTLIYSTRYAIRQIGSTQKYSTLNYIINRVSSLKKSYDERYIYIGYEKSPYFMIFDTISNRFLDIQRGLFTSAVLHSDISPGGRYLATVGRGPMNLRIFDLESPKLASLFLSDSNLVEVNNDIEVTSFSCKFVIGPATSYYDIKQPKYNISINLNSAALIDKRGKIRYTTTETPTTPPSEIYLNLDAVLEKKIINNNLALYHNYNQINPLNNLKETLLTTTNLNSTITKNSTNDINILDYYPNNYYKNIIQISSYYNRVAFLNVYKQLQIPLSTNIQYNNYTQSELIYLQNNQLLTNNHIKIAMGYDSLYTLTTDNKITSSVNTLFSNFSFELSDPDLFIKDISAGHSHLNILLSDSTILSFGNNTYNQIETSHWENVKQVVSGDDYTLALLYDGTLRMTNQSSVKTRIFNITLCKSDDFVFRFYHNLNIDYPLIQVYDNERNVIYPKNIIRIDENIIDVEFDIFTDLSNAYYTYYTVVIYNSPTQIHQTHQTHQITSSNDISIFQCHNQQTGEFIFPASIIELSPHEFSFIFSAPDPNIIISESPGISQYQEIVSTTSGDIVIEHNLNARFPFVQIYQNSNVILPDVIRNINKNSIHLQFNPIPGVTEYDVRVISSDEPSLLDDILEIESVDFIAGGPTDVVLVKIDGEVLSFGLNEFDVSGFQGAF